ncbi:MAG TPA: hypothetical protein VF139_17110 [Candidatus Polarisedimenticolaceae bacterium]
MILTVLTSLALASGPPSAPVPVTSSAAGWIDAEVDVAACAQAFPACESSPGIPAGEGNASPVRVVVQIQSSRLAGALALDDFDVRTAFSPWEAGPLAPATCDACFDAKEGGSYALWLAPVEGNWKSGTYFVTVGVKGRASLAPALLSVEIGGGAPPRGAAPPVAVIAMVPAGRQAAGFPVLFNANASSDPDSDPIMMYRWTVTSNNPDSGSPNPLVIEGPGVSVFDRIFSNVQALSVQLQVTDDPLAPEMFASGQPIPYPSAAITAYEIVGYLCDGNVPPVARIAGESIQASGSTGQLINVLLDGTLSSDPDQRGIADYVWSCGNNGVPQKQPPDGSKAVCTYLVGLSARTYTATLQVRDKGTGEFDPRTGDYSCAMVSAPDSIPVTIAPLVGPE